MPNPNGPDLDALLRIDPNRLEDECSGQARKVAEVGMKLAKAIDMRDREKRNLDRIEAAAELSARDLAARDTEARYKVSEGQIKAMVTTTPAVIQAQAALAYLQAEVGQLEPQVEAMRTRGYMLEHLVKLYVTRYHGGNIEQQAGRDLANQRAAGNDPRPPRPRPTPQQLRRS